MLLPVAESLCRRSASIHTKFRMRSATTYQKSIPAEMPEEQRRCVMVVGYINRQTVAATTTDRRKLQRREGLLFSWRLVMVGAV